MESNIIKKKKCVICGKTFYIKTNRLRLRNAKLDVKLRQRNAVTCSRECSHKNADNTSNNFRLKKLEIKINSWHIIAIDGTVYKFDQPKDVSEEEITFCIMEQIYGKNDK